MSGRKCWLSLRRMNLGHLEVEEAQNTAAGARPLLLYVPPVGLRLDSGRIFICLLECIVHMYQNPRVCLRNTLCAAAHCSVGSDPSRSPLGHTQWLQGAPPHAHTPGELRLPVSPGCFPGPWFWHLAGWESSLLPTFPPIPAACCPSLPSHPTPTPPPLRAVNGLEWGKGFGLISKCWFR